MKQTTGRSSSSSASKEPVFITQRGRVTAVLVSMEAYEKTQYEIGLLRAIAKGEADAALAIGEDLDGVFDRIDANLASTK